MTEHNPHQYGPRYQACSICGTLRPPQLLNPQGSCGDQFCKKALKEAK